MRKDFVLIAPDLIISQDDVGLLLLLTMAPLFQPVPLLIVQIVYVYSFYVYLAIWLLGLSLIALVNITLLHFDAIRIGCLVHFKFF